MTDFSFQNRVYDLLLNLKEDGIIGSKIRSVKDVRLLMDVIKTANQINKEYYRPVESYEILPGVRLKIIEPSCIWYHTFWTYEDTGRIIPPNETTLKAYSDAYMYIWKKAEKGNVYIKQTFKYEINDYVAYKLDQSIKGYIFDKCVLIGVEKYSKYTNTYMVEWDIPPKDIYWFNEDELIKMSEALPMKTNIKREFITYKEYNPKEWLRQQIAKGYDEAIHRTLLQRNQTHGINPDREFGWITKQRKKKFCHSDRPKHSAIQRKNDRMKRKEKHIYPFKLETKKIKDPLVRVKWIITGEIASIKKSYARQLVERNNGNYIYISKAEWRKYLIEIKGKPKLCLLEGKDIHGFEYSLGNRKTRRSTPNKHGITISKINKHKNTIFHKETPKLSEDDRLERSILDRERYLRKKGKKSLDDLKEQFKSDERRNEKFSSTEKWSKSFSTLYRVITTNIAEIAKGIFVSLPKKGVKVIVNDIIKHQHKLEWSEEKIKDFIRYLRLTTHGIFTGLKPVKLKKVKQIVEHEPIEFVTVILDPQKLKLGEDKQIIDEGGGMARIPIKFKRKNGKSNNTTT